ncbi:MAG: helicase-related protein [Candidatus Poribacteria bacterium]|nr:helicase-related protein [Candidatus Poribacteria bacterium]
MNETAFPIASLHAAFQNAIANQPVIITAPTGSGKSTMVPFWCAELSDRPVLVMEPRRVACRSLARWLSTLRGERLGTSVGYTVRFEDVSSKATRIRFVTPGVALRYAAGGELDAYGTIILDEFHERGLEADLFLAVCRKQRADARLVVMSATIAAQRIARFVGGTSLSAEGKVYPVDVRYLGGVTVPTSWQLAERVERGVQRALRETDGNMLVFLPGKGEITACLDGLRRMRNVEILPLHGGLPTPEQDRVFEETARRRIILSTNVAETSVTLPGITAVIDSGLVRQRIHQAKRVVLALCSISQASAEQRRGRAGRLMPGICYRLWEAHGQLEKETAPEIMREDLAQFALAVAATGFRPQELEFLDAPPDFAVERAEAQLQEWGTLSRDGALTDFGRRLAALPVDVSYARLLAKAPTALHRDVADLIAALERPAPLWRRLDRLSPAESDAISEARQKDLWRDHCDATAMILTLRCGDVRRHHLHGAAFAECRRIASRLRSFLDLPPLDKDRGPVRPDRAGLLHYLLHEWPDCAYVRRRKGDAWGNGQDEVLLDSSSLIRRETNAALILEKGGLAKGMRVQLLGRTASPCTFADLRKAGLGTPHLKAPKRIEDEIIAEVSFVYAGREIESERQPLTGSLLREAIADLILSGRLFPELGESLIERINAYNLHVTLKGDVVAVEPRAWLISRLIDLGVEAAQDWLLLSPDDFAFTLIDAETFAEINDNYPPDFSMNGAKFRVTYQPQERRVTLTWLSGVRQPRLSPWMLPHWNDWKVHVDIRGQLRTLRP